ncbi:hypothetical protein G5I_00868 [Acromyrmex echinatior]|uniref:Uncharacterized protein n=1 Tax=Acromyrmex echinatior TaxID=103372 RepID=F4W6N6_ACREC|nr:hypothetical protein G5I_00868 [Acromyrmex echinatior]
MDDVNINEICLDNIDVNVEVVQLDGNEDDWIKLNWIINHNGKNQSSETQKYKTKNYKHKCDTNSKRTVMDHENSAKILPAKEKNRPKKKEYFKSNDPTKNIINDKANYEKNMTNIDNLTIQIGIFDEFILVEMHEDVRHSLTIQIGIFNEFIPVEMHEDVQHSLTSQIGSPNLVSPKYAQLARMKEFIRVMTMMLSVVTFRFSCEAPPLRDRGHEASELFSPRLDVGQ